MPRQKAVQSKTIHAEHWDNHEVVLIRGLTGYDNDWIQDQIVRQTAGTDDMKIKVGAAQRLTLIRCIESWTFTDAFDQPIPWPPLSQREGDNLAICRVREKSLEHVFPDDRLFIYNAINALNQPLSEDEKKASSMNGNPGSQANTAASLIPLSIEK